MNNKFDYKIWIAIILGNTIAWADFALYAFFSPVLSKVFFPFASPSNAYILYFVVFALGFVFRPFGSAIAGIYADKKGRKRTLMATVAISSIVTALIGFLPTYHVAGIYAPVLLTILRIVQTMAISAEPTNSGSLLIEYAHPKRKGLITSCVMVGVFLGFLLGIFFFYIASSITSPTFFVEWGWRLSFIFFALLGIVVVFVLLYTEESPLFLQKKAEGKVNKNPLRDALGRHRMAMFIAFGYAMMMAVANYFLLGFIPDFLNHTIHLPLSVITLAITIGLTITVILIPLFGLLSDYIGRRPVMSIGAIGFVITSYPMTLLFSSGQPSLVTFALCIYGTFLAAVAATVPAALAEMFPFEVRCTAGALGYNLALVLLGGPTPVIAQLLVKNTDNLFSPFYFITAVALVHLIFVILSKETKDKDVRV